MLTCAYFAGTSRLPSRTTLILAKRNVTTGATAKYVEFVFGWDQPTQLENWRGAQYFGQGNDSAGQDYRIELIAVDLTTARNAKDSGNDAAVNDLAYTGRILGSVKVNRVAGQAPNDCPGP